MGNLVLNIGPVSLTVALLGCATFLLAYISQGHRPPMGQVGLQGVGHLVPDLPGLPGVPVEPWLPDAERDSGRRDGPLFPLMVQVSLHRLGDNQFQLSYLPPSPHIPPPVHHVLPAGAGPRAGNKAPAALGRERRPQRAFAAPPTYRVANVLVGLADLPFNVASADSGVKLGAV